MGPKPKSADDQLRFVLQAIFTTRDESGKVPLKSTNWQALGDLNNVKANSAFVRFRDIVNDHIDNGVKGLYPIGSRATAALAAGTKLRKGSASSMAGTQTTPSSTPATTAAPTATSSPVKPSSRKRKRLSKEEGGSDAKDDDDSDGEYGGSRATKKIAQKRPIKAKLTTPLEQPVIEQPDFAASFLDFDHAADLLSVDESHRLDIGRTSDADAEGESDAGF